MAITSSSSHIQTYMDRWIRKPYTTSITSSVASISCPSFDGSSATASSSAVSDGILARVIVSDTNGQYEWRLGRGLADIVSPVRVVEPISSTPQTQTIPSGQSTQIPANSLASVPQISHVQSPQIPANTLASVPQVSHVQSTQFPANSSTPVVPKRGRGRPKLPVGQAKRPKTKSSASSTSPDLVCSPIVMERSVQQVSAINENNYTADSTANTTSTTNNSRPGLLEGFWSITSILSSTSLPAVGSI